MANDELPKVAIFCDGACKPDPGQGEDKHLKEESSMETKEEPIVNYFSPSVTRYKLVVSYRGKFGTVTAMKSVTIPFVPHAGLGLLMCDVEYRVAETTDVIFNIEDQSYTLDLVEVKDSDFSDFRPCSSFADVKKKYVDEGWEIIDECE